ncbi:hypothetical protein [Arsenicicoccus dermatophilus]|uniref:hypothetical protein n=1 Tax=Arsenicicoccus dermatophilus TaxID=1076331 RepID=UPI003916FA47
MADTGRRRPRALDLVAAVLVVAATVALLVRAGSGPRAASSEHLRVLQVVSADEIEVGGVRQRERLELAHVDTPADRTAAGSGCLAERAREALTELLPVGSPVTVHELPGRPSRPGLTRATIETSGGSPVDVELVAAGVATPAPGVPPAESAPLRAAADHARSRNLGFYDPTESCTVPGQVRQVITALDSALEGVTAAGSGPVDLDRLDAGLRTAAALRTRLLSPGPRDAVEWRALSTDDIALLTARLDAALVAAQGVRLTMTAAAPGS